MKQIQRIIDKFDAFQRRHGVLGFPIAVFKKYGDDEAGHYSALLAYYGFLSLFPLLLVLTTVTKVLLRNDGELQRKVLETATTYIPVIGDELQRNVHNGATGLLLVVGTLLTLYGARGVADAFRGAVNHIWQVPRVKRVGFPAGLFKSVYIIIVGGLGILITPIVAGVAVSFSLPGVSRVVAVLVTAGMLFWLFVFLARTAQSVRRSLGEVWVGAAVATVGLVLLQALGTYILTHQLKHLNNLYGTFAIVLGLLYWLFLQMQVVVFAIEIDTVRAYKLWPRALNGQYLTDQDRAAYRLYAHRNRFHEEEEIGVTTKKRLEKN
ncbi:YihY/virulence factor BrkB family protein [Candidatus Saccharibacteria bacterium]|nr:YihY/virulence factor BrkB family protein [Candidatus Saccharibacteria bacterium]